MQMEIYGWIFNKKHQTELGWVNNLPIMALHSKLPENTHGKVLICMKARLIIEY